MTDVDIMRLALKKAWITISQYQGAIGQKRSGVDNTLWVHVLTDFGVQLLREVKLANGDEIVAVRARAKLGVE